MKLFNLLFIHLILFLFSIPSILKGHSVTLDNNTPSIEAWSFSSASGAPLSEDFSSGVPPTGWSVINPDNLEGWEMTTTTGSDGNSSQVARMDNYQYNAPGALDYLVMPSIDISRVTNPKLYFDVAYAPFGSNNYEGLHIEYATDGGTTFVPTSYNKAHLELATVAYQSSGWAPQQASHWRADTVDLSPYKSTQTVFQFVQTAGYGNGLFIDNIRVETEDPPIANFSHPLVACKDESITFTDLSMELPTNWSWSVSPNTVTYANGTSSTSQEPQISFDAAGTYNITLTVTSANGTHSTSTRMAIMDSDKAPILQDFSSGVPPTGWNIVNPDNLEGWEMTTTTGSDGNSSQVARMDNYQYNAPGTLDYLVMPSIDLSKITNPKLYFDVAYAPFNANNYESLHIEYSTDCGTAFVPTSYNKAHLELATVAYQSNGWAPQQASHWRADTVDLSPYKSTQTIFQFIQTAGYGNGLFIDNVRVEASDLPVANFSMSTATACKDDLITFTDLSTELPTSWNWSFSPNTVTFQNGTSASSQNPEVRFDETGSYTAMLSVTNSVGSVNHSETVTINLDDAGFTYGATEYCQDDSAPSPTITGLSGGIFGSTPAGLSLDVNTGEIDLVNSSPGTYTLTYSTNGTCPNFSEQTLTVNDGTLPPCAALAVEWVNFSGQIIKSKQVQLDWKIAAQQELKYFLLEHSTDGFSFSKIGKISTKSTQFVYQFIHQQPYQGLNYYRLQELSLDGSFSYSKTIQLTFNFEETTVSAYPNPVNDELFLDVSQLGNKALEVQIFDQLGRKVLGQHFEASQQSLLQLNVSNLISGSYFVELKYGEQQELIRLLKQ